ncbi:hypothetical protein [Streptomyces sp. NPDC088246]|uniref:hypothetical protein n=1 Tax=Streptomyces sp. NPDC088246 TaxID=3365842 RepID=UPI00380AFD3A
MSDDGDDWMARFIKEYDDMEDPDLRAELLMCHGIHPEVLASERRRIARRKKMSSTEQTTTPSVPRRLPRARRTSRAIRRPSTPRRAGSPHAYQVTRTRTIRTTRGTKTVVTTTVTTVTTTTVTTISS